MIRKITFVAPLVAVLLLAACGGGGNDAPPVDPLAGVPASATASAQALVSYLEQLPPLDAEAREPMAMETVMPPTSEDTEPQEPAGS